MELNTTSVLTLALLLALTTPGLAKDPVQNPLQDPSLPLSPPIPTINNNGSLPQDVESLFDSASGTVKQTLNHSDKTDDVTNGTSGKTNNVTEGTPNRSYNAGYLNQQKAKKPFSGVSALGYAPTITYGQVLWAIPAPVKTTTIFPQTPPASGNQVSPDATSVSYSNAPVPTGIVRQIKANSVELDQREAEPKGVLNVRIFVPQNTNAQEVVMAYPYPVKPPKIVNPIKDLPQSPNELKSKILSSGYLGPIDIRTPYPGEGWRWIQAFFAAEKKAGLGKPHTLITAFSWRDEMLPYVEKEVKLVNTVEEERCLLYQKATEEYTRWHLDLENSSISHGLYALRVKLNNHHVGQVQLPAGRWWIAGTHKIPGLKFYWQIPVTIQAGQIVNVQMTQINALVIQGSW